MNCKNVQYYIFGKNSLSELGNILEKKRKDENSVVIFVIDWFFEDKKIESKLPIKPNDMVIFACTKNEPHAEYIDELTDKIKEKCKGTLPVAIVGMGGGSAMDIAKCISILLTNLGKAEDYQGWSLVKNPAVYKIGIPTLSGTGAEVTRTAVITTKTRKLGINSDYSIFDQIIMDPILLETVPKDQLIYTAMDCYIHCVEALNGKMNNAMTVACARKSLELLKEIFLGEMDYDKLMVASYFGGIAVANSSVTICHPLSYGLSFVLGYRHGLGNCIAFNQIEEYYGGEVKEFRKILLKHRIELPKNIMQDVSPEQINRMVEATLKMDKALENAFGENWIKVFGPEKIKELLRRM